jgi:hypothetical protein
LDSKGRDWHLPAIGPARFRWTESERPSEVAQVLFEHYGIQCTKDLGAGLFPESWAELSDAVFLSVWNFHETPAELEPDDDSSDDGASSYEPTRRVTTTICGSRNVILKAMISFFLTIDLLNILI